MNIFIQIFILIIICSFNNCIAQNNNILSDAQVIEAQEIYSKVRCPTCVVQSVKDSSTIASTQIRSYINHQIMQGASEEQILNNLRSYYGNDIVYKPVFNLQTMFLWVIPILFILYALYKLFLLKKFNF